MSHSEDQGNLERVERVLYLLHFSSKVGRAQHYLGITTQRRLIQRMLEHAGGRGARLTALAASRGIEMKLVRTWTCEGYDDERRKKNGGHFSKLCPVCSTTLAKPCRTGPYLRLPDLPQQVEMFGASFEDQPKSGHEKTR